MEHEQQIQPEEILEVVEIELFAIEEKPLPRAKRYIIRVDKEKVTVHKPEMTGAEILALVKKTPVNSSSTSTAVITNPNSSAPMRSCIFTHTTSSASPPCPKTPPKELAQLP